MEYNEIMEGGCNLFGDSLVNVKYFELEVSSGVILEGFSELSFFVPMLGGVSLSGVSQTTFFVNEPPNGILQGGLFISGGASSSQQRFFPLFLSSGEVLTQGNAKAAIKSLFFNAKGGVTVEETESLKPNFKFNYDLEFKWRINSFVIKDLTFTWNLGLLAIFWYRVVGKGIEDPCLSQDPCCQKIILNVRARSLPELCEKLGQRRYKFPIDFVQRFSRPVNDGTVPIANLDEDCNELIDVEVCNIPECAEFCVDQDLIQDIGFDIKLQINSFFDYESDGSLAISGFANISFTRNLKGYDFTGSGGISISGDYEYYPDHFYMRGGTQLGGVAKSAFSRWVFESESWPSQTDVKYPLSAKSVSQSPNETIWSLAHRILLDDGLSSSSDVSYLKSSQALIASNFNFNLPNFANILQIVITIERRSSGVGVRDKEVYLMLNDMPISENLAATDTNWPLIDTKKNYVIDVNPSDWKNPLFESQVPAQKIWQNKNIQAQDINDFNFSILLKVKNIAPVVAVARVDYVSVQAIYENQISSIIKIGKDGGARSIGQTYYFDSSGGLFVGNKAVSSYRRYYKQKVSNFGVKLNGTATFISDIEASGSVLISGESYIQPYIEIPEGGLKIGTVGALINPEWYSNSVELYLGGKAQITNIYYKEFKGSILLGGNSVPFSEKIFYESSGGFIINGSARAKVSRKKYESDGNIILIHGKAKTKIGNFDLEDEVFGFDMSIFNIASEFLRDVELNNLTGVTGNLIKCGCFNLPFVIQFSQNFSVNNIFSSFLIRNGFFINKTLNLKYNEINDSWQNNIHFKGLSPDNKTTESWDVVSELSCNNEIGGFNLGSSVWRLSVQIFRKNLLNGDSYDSRIMVAIIPNSICLNELSVLDFDIEINTQSKIATIDPDSKIYQSIIYDNIGMFKNPAWLERPLLELKVSQIRITVVQPRLDLTNTILR